MKVNIQMRKKVLFMVINMNVGGTEKALLNMISVMPREQYDITILMLEKYGGFLDFVPKGVNIEYLQEYQTLKLIINSPPLKLIVTLMKELKIINAIVFFYLYLVSLVKKERSLFYKYIFRNYSIQKEFDIAIAYAGPMELISFFVANKINAKRKIQWIHFDVTKIGFNKYFASKIYSSFNRIYVVSEEGRKKLNKLLPSLSKKTEVFLNITPEHLIKKLADDGPGFYDDFSGIRILTVGRLSKEKGQDLAIPVLAKLKQDGFNIRWYCIGDGNARSEYENSIKENGVMDDFILLGTKPNPYPFMKQCDIYVQPSRHEGYCITLAEAKCFNKPIVCTSFTGASEQIINGKTGLIVNSDWNQIYEGLKKIIVDRDLFNEMAENSRKEKSQNQLKTVDL